MSPSFFIIGAAKAATTSLSSLLDQHPEAGIAQGKEPHFFSEDRQYALGWPWYLELYRRCEGKRIVGDASTSYSRIRHHPAAIERIHRHVPGAKIIYMVRHPLERMESAYVEHLCSPGSALCGSINDAVRRIPMIVDSSRYWEVFDAYRQRFGESKVKLVWFEEYVADTSAVFREVCRFLDIDDSVAPPLAHERLNARAEAGTRMKAIGRGATAIDGAWAPETRRWVIDQIREDNLRLLDHFGRSREYWGGVFA